MIVLIPAHNEADNIAELIRRVRAQVPEAEIAVIDDGSNDGTGDIALANNAIVFTNEPGAEYGDGFRSGLLLATARQHDYAVFIDAGLSYQPEDIPRLAKAALDVRYDVVIGSRIVKGATYQGNRLRRWMTKSAIFVISLFLSRRRLDYSGFRILTKEACEELLPQVERIPNRKAHVFNLWLLVEMKVLGLNIEQVPVHYRVTGSRLNFRTTLEAMLAVFKIGLWRLSWAISVS